VELPGTALDDLGEVRLKSGKVVLAYAAAGDLDPDAVRSNTFELEWPPRSGRTQAFPEVDRAEWFALTEARAKLNPAQAELVDRLEALLAGR
jgi:predicted NUDIX family NTP pyrophosphohydrolase